MTAERELDLDLTTPDGLRLHASLAAPPTPIGALILCHGITTDCEEHGAFPRLRDRALKAGLAVVRFDFRAHGRSAGTNEALRLVGMRTDLETVLELIREQFGAELPWILVAVSFSGSAAVHVAASEPGCVGLVLWYTVLDYPANFGAGSPVPFTQLMLGSRSDSDPAWSVMPLADGYHLPAGLAAEMPADGTLELLDRLSVPVIGFYGSRDKLIYADSLRTIARANPNIELHSVPGAGHGFLLWRPWIMRRTVAWAAGRARAAR